MLMQIVFKGETMGYVKARFLHASDRIKILKESTWQITATGTLSLVH